MPDIEEPLEDGRYPYPYDDVIRVDDNGNEYVVTPIVTRPSRPATPEALAAWELRAYPKLAAQRAALTPIDDELPDDPRADPEKTRIALRRIFGA